MFGFYRWVKLSGTDLLPGDVVSIGRSSGQNGEEKSVPADMLLLAGSVIVNEAILTGESTPQWKVLLFSELLTLIYLFDHWWIYDMLKSISCFCGGGDHIFLNFYVDDYVWLPKLHHLFAYVDIVGSNYVLSISRHTSMLVLCLEYLKVMIFDFTQEAEQLVQTDYWHDEIFC